MEVCTLLCLAALAYIVVQVVRLMRADGDLQLMWAEKFGKKTDCMQGKVVWIVGASGGIGEHLSYKLAAAGCRLILSARRESELQRVAKECLARSQQEEDTTRVLPMDVLDLQTHKEKFECALRQFGHVDILVSNAGRAQRAYVMDTPFEIDRQIMELNYFATVSLTKTVLPYMTERRQGYIVVTSSILGKFGIPFSASYCATKYALQGWCDSLRSEVSGSGIDVTMVCPGPVFSGVQKAAFSTKVGEEYGIELKPSENRVSTSRCAELMAIAMANRMYEVWISNQPTLTTTYLFQYMPGTTQWLISKFGIGFLACIQHVKEGAKQKQK